MSTQTPEGQRLATFARAVRESTLKRLRRVPPGQENWRIAPGAMSFADLAQHLVDTDEWLFKKMEVKTLDPIVGYTGAVEITDRADYLALLDALVRTGAQRCALLESLTEDQLDEKIFDARFGGEVSLWWIIVRGNLDHEIHHRGQIAAYLRAIEAKAET
ncbi:MAG: DinB family protein [Bacteroidetes bacterium]|nr:DinB family protein [Bacteroidota bacterium]